MPCDLPGDAGVQLCGGVVVAIGSMPPDSNQPLDRLVGLRESCVTRPRTDRDLHFESLREQWMRPAESVWSFAHRCDRLDVINRWTKTPKSGVLVLALVRDKKIPAPALVTHDCRATQARRRCRITIVPGDMSKERLEMTS